MRDGEVVLYKRGESSRWQARFKLPSGDWCRISTKRSDLREAQRIASEEYDRARFRASEGIAAVSKRFSEVAKITSDRMDQEVRAGTGKVIYRDYKQAIETYLIPFFGNRHIDKITQEDMLAFDEWRTEKMKRRPSKSTLLNHNSALNRIFEVALSEGWVTRIRIPALHTKGEKSKRRPDFTQDEWRRVAANLRHWVRKATTDRSKAQRELLWDYVLILANTGMRTGTEVYNLRWRHLRWHTAADGRRHLLISPSGKTGQRELVAREGCHKFFRRIQLRFPELAKLSFDELLQKRSDEFVFRLRTGERTKNLYNTFRDFLTEYDLLNDSHGNPRTLYSLRHTYATLRLAKDRIPIHSLAKQMGTSVQMLEQHYSHLEPVMIADQLAGKPYKD